jgi:long-chain acyl-CoA synthetase
MAGSIQEMFKTSGGKYIAPQMMENKFKESRFIEQIIVIGENEKMPAALVVPDIEFIKEWSKRKGIDLGSTYEEMANNEALKDRIAKEIEQYNENFGKWEQIKVFEIVPSPWTVEGTELTPTMKLKRKVIMSKYDKLVQKIYRKK